LEDVGQQLIEDNIVSLSRQMIDKEASVAKPKGANGQANASHKGQRDSAMEVDDEL